MRWCRAPPGVCPARAWPCLLQPIAAQTAEVSWTRHLCSYLWPDKEHLQTVENHQLVVSCHCHCYFLFLSLFCFVLFSFLVCCFVVVLKWFPASLFYAYIYFKLLCSLWLFASRFFTCRRFSLHLYFSCFYASTLRCLPASLLLPFWKKSCQKHGTGHGRFKLPREFCLDTFIVKSHVAAVRPRPILKP